VERLKRHALRRLVTCTPSPGLRLDPGGPCRRNRAIGVESRGLDYIERVRQGSRKLERLIDDVLRLSRVTRAELRRRPVDLSALAVEMSTELKKSQPERDVRFTIAPGLTAHGDQRLVRVALEHLLENAWKFTSRRRKAVIEFGTTGGKGGPVYFVRDNGAGFDMAHADRLFAPFQRLHGAGEFPGAGVGLATVRRIANRHGGRAWAEGKVDGGATFYVSFGVLRDEWGGERWDHAPGGG